MDSILFLLNSTPSSPNAARAFMAALTLRTQGHPVSLCLMQDAVLAGLETGEDGVNARTAHVLQAGVSMYALGEDLALRGFTPQKLYAGIQVADYPQLLDLFEQHARVIGAL
ncbi:MAG: DsrE family protein [Chloroflexi bacterium]|nr:DsrE family protein [Chloroflexota bacterium]